MKQSPCSVDAVVIAGAHKWLVFYLFPNTAKQRAGTGVCVYPSLSSSQSWQGDESREDTGSCCWLLLGLEKKKRTRVQQPILQQLHINRARGNFQPLNTQHVPSDMAGMKQVPPTQQWHLRFTSPWESLGVNGWEENCRRLSLRWGWATPLAHPRVLSWAEIMFNKASEELPPLRSSKLQRAQEWEVGFAPVQQSQARLLSVCGNDFNAGAKSGV